MSGMKLLCLLNLLNRRVSRLAKLISVVLGEEALNRPLEETLRECCREFRPSSDPREQQRFEAEFIELGIWPESAQHKIAA